MDAISHSNAAASADAPDPAAGAPAPLAAAILHSRFPLRPAADPDEGPAHGLDIVAPHVDAQFYRALYPGLPGDGLDAASHYHATGWREGRNPNPWFDTVFYLQNNADVARSGMDPLLHYVLHGRAGGRQPRAPEPAAEPPREDRDLAAVAALMDLDYYRGVYPDIDVPELDPVEHFHRAGWREGRNPNPWFDTAYYLRTYPDIRRAGIDPLLHYHRHGRAEGRYARAPGGYRRAAVDRAMPPADRPLGYDAPDGASDLDEVELRERLREACAGATGLVVAVSHDRYVDLTGGVQIFIADEQSWFNGDRFAYMHLSPAIARLTLDRTTDAPAVMQIVIDGSFVGLAPYETIEAALAALPEGQPPVRAFVVHSLFGHRAADLVAIAAAMRATTCCFWLHDYATVCEGYNLLRDDIAFCDAPPADSAACRVCVYGADRPGWRAAMHALFSALPFEVLAPSRAALDLWQRAAGLPCRWARVHPNASFEPAPIEAAPAVAEAETLVAPVRVAFVGYPLPHKGWPLFMELVRAARPLGPYRFYHFCTEKNRQPMAGLVSVAAQVDGNDRFAMIAALAEHEIDLVLVLSPWPETFSYVTFEAFAAGADVVALAASGNVVDAVRAHDRGVVVRDDQALLRFFTDFAAAHYVIDQRRAGRRPGAMRLAGTTATYDPAAPEGDAGDLAVTEPLLGVLAGDAVLDPERDGDRYRFELPEAIDRVRIVSRSLVPAAMDAASAERRRLGVLVGGLSLDGDPVPPGDWRLASGWHDPDPDFADDAEPTRPQWTDGNATLLTDGARRLEFTLAGTQPYRRCPLGDPAR